MLAEVVWIECRLLLTVLAMSPNLHLVSHLIHLPDAHCRDESGLLEEKRILEGEKAAHQKVHFTHNHEGFVTRCKTYCVLTSLDRDTAITTPLHHYECLATALRIFLSSFLAEAPHHQSMIFITPLYSALSHLSSPRHSSLYYNAPHCTVQHI